MMNNLSEYISEKLHLTKDAVKGNKMNLLPDRLYKRLLPDNYHLKNKILEVLTKWIDDNNITDIDGDIFYAYSNKDRLEKVVEDTSYLHYSSYVETYLKLIEKLHLSNMMTSAYKKIGNGTDKVNIYVKNNRLVFVHGNTSVKFVVYLNAFKNKSL